MLDSRTIYEFVQDNRRNNLDSYPNFKPNMLIKDFDHLQKQNYNEGFIAEGGKIFPLSNISNILTTTGNEGGFYPNIKTDRYGFNNDDIIYNKIIDIALLGDSFVEGSDVNPIDNISSILLNNNYNTLNLGKSHSGPLVQYAILKEYLIKFKPKKVFWFYFANDHKDLTNELRSQTLLKYLNENDFSQNLISKQQIVDSVLKKYFQLLESNYVQDIKNVRNYYDKKDYNHLYFKRILRVVKLFNLRGKLNLLIDMRPIEANKNQLKIQKKIIIDAKKIIESWNGELKFVFIPQYTRGMSFISQELNWIVETDISNEVIKMLIENDLEYIDLAEHIYAHEDPLSLYPFRIPLHFNEKGYAMISKILIEDLNKQ